MKNIFISLLVLLVSLLCSCDGNVKNRNGETLVGRAAIIIVTIEGNTHELIMCGNGITHSPDCSYCKSKKCVCDE